MPLDAAASEVDNVNTHWDAGPRSGGGGETFVTVRKHTIRKGEHFHGIKTMRHFLVHVQ